MPTRNPRINITFNSKTAAFLAHIAEDEDKSLASVAKELILEALEYREDISLSALAEARDAKSVKRVSHKNAWK